MHDGIRCSIGSQNIYQSIGCRKDTKSNIQKTGSLVVVVFSLFIGIWSVNFPQKSFELCLRPRISIDHLCIDETTRSSISHGLVSKIIPNLPI